MEVLKTENLTRLYCGGGNRIKALYQVNINIQDGEFIAIVGSSGSGKTTLLNMLGGLDYPTEGSVTVRKQKLEKIGRAHV